jgi:hypothetical protein
MLVTLKLYLSDGRERQLSHEVADDPATPHQILERISSNGRVRLSDRESFALDDVERVELVPPPEPRRGPNWTEEGTPEGLRLRDEDVSAALREQHGSD